MANDTIPTIKVQPWGKGQGDYVEINADDFDPKVHTPIEGEAVPLKVDVTIHDDGNVMVKPTKPRARKTAKAAK